MINLKRIYENPAKDDGIRILVDRLWPRGVSKEKAKLDLWMKEIAPSDALRKWFAHDPKKWIQFQKKYLEELKKGVEQVRNLENIIKEKKKVTLLYAAKDKEHNEAIVIKEFIDKLDEKDSKR